MQSSSNIASCLRLSTPVSTHLRTKTKHIQMDKHSGSSPRLKKRPPAPVAQQAAFEEPTVVLFASSLARISLAEAARKANTLIGTPSCDFSVTSHEY